PPQSAAWRWLSGGWSSRPVWLPVLDAGLLRITCLTWPADQPMGGRQPSRAGPAEQRGRRGVAGQHGGLHAMQRHLLEPEPQDRRDGLGHQATTPVVPGQVVSEEGEAVLLAPAGVPAGADDAGGA